MTVTTAQISDSLQTLIDSRLDTIERMLLGRIPRQDRLAIVREVESQIHELLQANDSEELTREDVLAVLARLDPPEAYIPEESESERVPVNRTIRTRERSSVVKDDSKVGRASGLLGLTALAVMLLFPVDYFIGVALQLNEAVIFLFGGNLLLMFTAGVLGLAIGIIARKSGLWAFVGIVTSSLALLLSLALLVVGILLG
jgi:hypothetical protein